MVAERGSDVEELLDLQIGKANLCLPSARIQKSPPSTISKGQRSQPSSRSITKQYFAKRHVPVTIVLVGGACEATPYLGIADAIVDLLSSGIP